MLRYLMLLAAWPVLAVLSSCGGSDSPDSAAYVQIPLPNASFDQLTPTGALATWQRIEHNQGNSYTFSADTTQVWSPPSSARINRYGPEDFGLLSQKVIIQSEWIGKTVRLSGYLRTEQADGVGAALVLQSLGGGGQIFDSNLMDGARVTGSQGWKWYSIQLKLVPGSYFLHAGTLLEGSGTLWADDLRLEIID